MAAVGIDLDGVCYNFADSFREHLMLSGIRFKHQCPEATRWEFYEDWGFTLDEFLTHCHRGVEAGVIFTHGDPYEGTREALVSLHDAGHQLHVVTDRSFGRNGASEAATRAWLDFHDLPFDSLTFSADKTIVRTNFMVDDKLANYDALRASGCEVYLLDRPWNQDDGSRLRVHSLAEFVQEVA